ncbi:RNA-guided endonuclease InsQ/TnpB family protein [Ktedonobacter racemifer]|uniref:Putative transposase IS891/IS1136/IS1341 family n=1 Tax=Ktedonobacter racemifer DSM 44963 TaxID=485913 RepID=D6U5J9_KTERA|nr:RNA-guided endonuclease TnpB family protein [Ktedonobacter racemifer]EFH80260.1 putative transposase IS891/IS1136/IS1341 family [Ktedonobacter racemifer DSM 44963]
MIKTHKIRLYPTPEQAHYFARAAGTSRFAWNWALAEWNRQYEAGEKPTALKLKKQFNEIRRVQFPWTWEVTKNASDQPFLDLGKAFTAFFEGRARRPKFKSKKTSKPSFYLANDQFELGDHRMWIPKLGWVNLAEKLRFQGNVTGARLTRQADWWFVSIQVEIPDTIAVKKPAAVGIDVGLNRLTTLSTGEEVENQAFLKTTLKKLRQANKRLHRRKLGSKNREKARRLVARLHYRITCLRQDVLQKLTTRLTDSYGIIGVEDLHLKGLLKNRRLARSFADASLGTLRRLLEAKAAQRGGQIIKVGRFFPSSKTCHCCGWTWEAMTLKDRIFVCQNSACPYDQFPQDRDHNAGQNVLREALRLIGLLDQAVSGTGSDEDANLPADAG